MVGVTERGVLVERDLSVEGHDVALFRENEGVDLNERGVFARVHLVELDHDRSHLVNQLSGELGGYGNFLGLDQVDSGNGVDVDACEGIRTLFGQLLNLHATLEAREGQVGTVGPVEQHGEVVLLLDARTGGNHDALDHVALDVEAQDGLSSSFCLVGVLGHLDAARFTAAAHFDLGFDDNNAT